MNSLIGFLLSGVVLTENVINTCYIAGLQIFLIMAIFYRKKETQVGPIIRYKYRPLIFIPIFFSLAYPLFLIIGYLWATTLVFSEVMLVLLYIIDSRRPNRGIIKTMKEGSVQLSTRRFSFFNPIAVIIGGEINMKKTELKMKLVSFVFVSLLMASMFAGLVSANASDMDEISYFDISVEDSKLMIDSDPNLIILDVRTQSEYDSGHIEDAVLIPVSELEERIDELDTDKKILVYCNCGGKSANASDILIQYGFEGVYNMERGITAWTDLGYPVVSNSEGLETFSYDGSLSSEIDEALENNKSVFIYFYIDSCHFCEDQKPIIDGLEQEYADEIAFIRVNGQENPQAMNEFGVGGFPTMFLIVDKGDERYVYQRFGGFTEKEVFGESFDYIIENGTLPEDYGSSYSSF